MIGAFGRFEYALADRYRIERELGRGGMATVYLARDVARSRPVAIKLMHPSSDPERFLSEIRMTAGLTHPGIVPLYESDRVDGMPYFVMPYVGGETLRQRLRREGALAVEDAVSIAEQVASALDYAHRNGIVHRDVKPENILLAPSGDADGSERAVLLDLGVAHAVATPDDQRLTQTGASPGTPLYMAPEQLEGGRDVDRRADQYAVAAVLYEMLVGEPPFVGANAHLRKLAMAAPSVREARPKVPAGVAAAVARGLERMPADRFRSCAEFCEALRRAEAAEESAPAPRPSPRPRFGAWAMAGLALVVALAGVASLMAIRPVRNSVRCAFICAQLDPNRYAIFPFQHLGGGAHGLLPDVQLHEAFDRWRDLDAVEQYQARAAWGQRDTAAFGADDGVEAAWSLRAGRYVVGSVAHLGERVKVSASLHDARRGGRLIATASVTVPTDDDAMPSFHALADSLLFEHRRTGRPVAIGGTTSVEAQRAYLRAHDAVAGWDLRAADSLFAAAVGLDDAFAKAQLWLAQVRSWRGEVPVLWAGHAQRAADRGADLSPHERRLATALLLLSTTRYPAACRVYDAMYAEDSLSFEASFGRGECRRLDDAVMPDARSPSGWGFRASSHAAVQAYRRAFELIPASNYAFREGAYSRLRQLLKVRASERRSGSAVSPDTGVFAAYAAWDTEADTLAFVPYRLSDPGARRAPSTIGIALRRNREAFREVARRWTAAYPRSPDAAEAMALALDLAADDAAIGEVRRARALATDRVQGTRLRAMEVWLRLKFGAPDATAIASARALADSLLSEPPFDTPEHARLLAGVATLRADGPRAAQLARAGATDSALRAARGHILVPRRVTAPLAEYEVYATLGDPANAAMLGRQVRDAIRQALNDAEADRAERALLRAPSMVALVHGVPLPAGLSADGSILMEAAVALGARDTAAARAILDRARAVRRGFPIGEMTADARLVEGYLLEAVGEPQAAAAWLDDWLRALPQMGAVDVSDVVRCGSVPAIMRLRARIAERLGDRVTAARWSSAVRALQGPR